MSISIYGAFRTDTTMSNNTATYATIGSTFQISSYSKITITDGADPTIISGDSSTNETPNDPTQTLGGSAITWDYTIEVTDGTNTYEVGVMDYDLNGNGTMQWPGPEQGYFIAFIGDIPPLNTTLTVSSVTNNGPSIPADSVVICFASGTLIDTPEGACKVEQLQVGDMVLTADNGAQPIRWIGASALDLRALALAPKLHPIRICAGALGDGLPKRDLLVSPQHRMLVRSPSAARMLGGDEVLIAAKKLGGMPGIAVDTVAEPVTYFHMLFDSHEVVFAEGAPAESLFAGQEALKSVGRAAYEEIMTLFPELATDAHAPAMARHSPTKAKQIDTLVRRHVDNGKPLVAHP